MDALFDFLGSYWWLAFPLIGVVASLGGAWERGAKRRHKRRLEIIRAKSELRAAQAAARGKPALTASAGSSESAAGSEGSRVAQLERLFETHDRVTARWLEYELDVAKLIAFPAMSDGRQPLTAAFLRAKRTADGLRPASAKDRLTKDQLAEYRTAVVDYEVAFEVAERDARRVKDSSFSVDERKRLDTAKQLLSVAIDQAATPAERQIAYRRVREELDGLISLSDDAIEVLETRVALELTTGDAPDTDASDAPSRPAPPRPAAPPPPDSEPSTSGSSDAPWPVPARNADRAPGHVVRPKTHPSRPVPPG